WLASARPDAGADRRGHVRHLRLRRTAGAGTVEEVYWAACGVTTLLPRVFAAFNGWKPDETIGANLPVKCLIQDDEVSTLSGDGSPTACDGGDATACTELGNLLMLVDDPGRAANLYTKACNAGDAKGCMYLGALRVRGNGVPKDEARGATLLAKACDGGD